MKIRLGTLEVRLSRYLGLWSLVVLVFAMQGCVNDAVNAHLWSPGTYLRWSAVQWLTWAALAPLVFRLGERHPIPFPPRLSALARHVGHGEEPSAEVEEMKRTLAPEAVLDAIETSKYDEREKRSAGA